MTRILHKNHSDFFLVKTEDLIPPKMKRTRRCEQTPFAQTKKALFYEKNVSMVAQPDDLPEAVGMLSKIYRSSDVGRGCFVRLIQA